MNNLRLFKLALSILLFSFAFNVKAQDVTSSQINFLKNDFETAKETAMSEEKLIILKFSAKWCMPCKLMDEHVWTNPSLSKVVNKNCVSISADFDHMDCYEIKQKYKVISLPAILILNACGDVLTRIDKSCSSSEILDEINVHNKEKNKICAIRSIKPLIPKGLTTVKSVSKNNLEIGVDVPKVDVDIKKELVILDKPKKKEIKKVLETKKEVVKKTDVFYISKPVIHNTRPKYYLSSNPISRPHSSDFAALGLPMH